MASIKLTAKQGKLTARIERHLGLNLLPSAFRVKNNIIGLEVESLNQQQVHAIEFYGIQFGGYKVVPGGFKKINLIFSV